ncbi:MAG TPA: Gfo/Idh/MocA family oxidoreductase [bacterium]|nr:Gfo/Idh/MocA family oxidoreductase [bacterium]
MTERMGWGIVGTGERAREAMIPAVLASPAAAIVGVCSREAEKAREQVAAWPELKVFSGLDEMARDPGVEIIYIATPHFLHVPQAVQAIDAGKHVFMESPMALSVDGAHKLVEKARARGVMLGVAFQYRFHSAVIELKQRVMSGEAGLVRHVGVNLSEPVAGFTGWWADSFRSGPAALLRLGVHALDLAAFLAGKPAVETVAMTRDEGAERTNTVAGALLRFQEDVVGTVLAATCLSEHHHLAVVDGSKGRLEIKGDFSGAGPVELVHAAGGKQSVKRFEPEDPAGKMVDAFIKAAKTGAEFHPDGLDGKHAVEITCALIESIKARKTMKVGEVQRLT